MHNKFVITDNVLRLSAAGENLINRSAGLPGLALIEGLPGLGKTKAVTWYFNRCNGIYLRALKAWTPKSMLQAILEGCGLRERGSPAELTRRTYEALAISRKPLFIDELDHLVKSRRADDLIEVLRDVHDMSSVPIFMIGEEGVARSLAHHARFTSRIMRTIKFHPMDLEEARKVADALCEVKVRDDLLERIHGCANGNMRLTVIGLSAVESSAKARGLAEIGASQWGKSDEFFTGDAPAMPPVGKLAAVGGAAK